MQYLIRHDLTGETFKVDGATRKQCRDKADTECAQRGWNIEQVGSERIETESLNRKPVYTKENAR